MKKLILILCAIFLLGGCRPKVQVVYPVSQMDFMLNTITKITVYTYEGKEDPKELIDQCYELMKGYEKLLSRTIEGSDIYKINHAKGAAVTVDEETAQLLEKALAFSKLTDGAFDPTVEPVSSMWNFVDDGFIPPDEETVAQAAEHIDYRNIEIKGNVIRLLDPEAAIDLGGVAKGYIGDKGAAFLKEHGVTGAVLDVYKRQPL